MKHEADEHKYRARGRCFLQLRREISHGPRHDRFLRPGGRGDSNRWSVWSEAGGKGTRRQLAKGVFGHVDDGGRRRIGEAGPIGVPSTLVSAVLDALAPFGVKEIHPPLYDEKLWRAIHTARPSATG